MTTISSTINASFLRRLQALNPASKSVNPARAAISGGGVSVRDTLRFGARTFAASVQRLNVAITGVNVAQTGLEGLRSLVDEMLVLADEAASSGTGKGRRRQLNSSFQQLGLDFQQVIEDLNGQEFEYLSKEGIRDILLQAGLDPDESEGIASLFSELVGEGVDGLLVSDDIQPDGPVRFRPGAGSDTTPRLQSAGQGTTESVVTALGNVFSAQDTDTFTGENPTSQSLIFNAFEGTVRSLEETLSSDVKLVGAEGNSSTVAISSVQDFQGFNASGSDQLFLVDSSLQVAGQVTNNTDPAVSIASASVSSDGLTVVAREENSGTGLSDIVLYQTSEINQDPATATRTVLAAGVTAGSFEPQVSNDGSYVAYENGTGGVQLADTATLTGNTFLASETNIESVGFVSNGGLAVVQNQGASFDISTISYGDTGYQTTLAAGLNTGGSATFSTLQTANDNLGYVAFLDNSDSVSVVDLSGNDVVSFDYSGATISSLSLAPNGSSGQLVVGATAQLPGDTQTESYISRQGVGESTRLPKFSSLFDGGADILSRRAAVSVRANLEAIAERIDQNYEALEGAKEVIGDNLDLVRVSGFAFLNISNEISGEEEAADVATLLARRIREDASSALSQAENLELMVVAALTSEGSLE